jgi:hypothetical protein
MEGIDTRGSRGHKHAKTVESVHDANARSRVRKAESLRRKRMYDAQHKQRFAGHESHRSKSSEPTLSARKGGRPRSTLAVANTVRNTAVGPASLHALSFDKRDEVSVPSDSSTSASGMISWTCEIWGCKVSPAHM